MVGSSSTVCNPELVLAHKFPETVFNYTERDVAVYALGVGSCIGNAVDEKELKYVYHENGQKFIQVLPTFAAVFPFALISNLRQVEGLQIDPHLLLHGQQYMEIYKPLPSSCSIQNRAVISGLHDKGKAAVVEIETTSYNKETGEALCMNRSSVYLRGAGGFSKSTPLYSYSKYPASQVSSVTIPKTSPFSVYEESTNQSQALLYRLSGDYNPLHSDPIVARVAGFSRPILHGLCSLGFAVRAIVKCLCNGDPALVKSVLARFLLPVYPGETLITKMWLDGSRVLYLVIVKERNRSVLSGNVFLHHRPSSSL
ncbi:enoyl-CoA hydratase 2, peroxisomal-like [Aristolochia californica]|uniref:enoyl-CoA hydratase 2, peroxisomal-like n=1 Tax=Aristolochia californica TaxID=171875 RepID=UPI0035E05559